MRRFVKSEVSLYDEFIIPLGAIYTNKHDKVFTITGFDTGKNRSHDYYFGTRNIEKLNGGYSVHCTFNKIELEKVFVTEPDRFF